VLQDLLHPYREQLLREDLDVKEVITVHQVLQPKSLVLLENIAQMMVNLSLLDLVKQVIFAQRVHMLKTLLMEWQEIFAQWDIIVQKVQQHQLLALLGRFETQLEVHHYPTVLFVMEETIAKH